MTVREAFEKAFGPLPEGATSCHVGTSRDGENGPYIMEPTCSICSSEWPYGYKRGEWSNNHCYEFPNGPDISSRPASAFLGFFGEEYDRVVMGRMNKEQTERVRKFIEAIIELSKEHGLTISHEDGHGAFAVMNYREENIQWLSDAHDWT